MSFLKPNSPVCQNCSLSPQAFPCGSVNFIHSLCFWFLPHFPHHSSFPPPFCPGCIRQWSQSFFHSRGNFPPFFFTSWKLVAQRGPLKWPLSEILTNRTIYLFYSFIHLSALYPQCGSLTQPWDRESHASPTEPARHFLNRILSSALGLAGITQPLHTAPALQVFS